MNKKSGYVALIGRPNVGKSTLMNHLIGQKIAITSDKPQTTRNRIQTVYTDDRGQIVFLDTPGIHKAKNKLGEYMMLAANRSIQDADVLLWLTEADPYIGKSDRAIARQLSELNKPVILALNKTDLLEQKEQVLPLIASYHELLPAAEIVPVSALKCRNTEELLQVLFQYLPEGPLYFDEETVTDQPVKEIAAEIIREKALRLLSEEVPHGIAVVMDRFSVRENGRITDVEATIVCERESHKGIIIGHKGEMLKRIGSAARPEIEDLIEGRVNLQLWVKVRDNWRDSDTQIKNFGYDGKEIR